MIHYSDVPFHSQLSEIASYEWQMQGCGVASLAMEIDFFKPKTASVMKLLKEGLSSGAYVKNVGWSHQGLADLAEKYGLEGKVHDFSKLKKDMAFAELADSLSGGPVIASIYNKFNPKSTLGHLIVVTGFDEDYVYYNNPASTGGEKKIGVTDFLSGWKKRYITIREKKNSVLSLIP